MQLSQSFPLLALTTIVSFPAAQIFSEGTAIPDLVADPFATAFALGDLDHDGHLDLATIRNLPAGSLQRITLRGDGAGGFVAATTTNFPSGPVPFFILSGPQTLRDIDGDGFSDLLFGARLLGGTGIFFGGASDSPVRTAQIPELSGAMFTDFNGDGLLDSMGSTGGIGLPERVVIALGQGGSIFGAFTDVIGEPLVTPAFRPTLTADWNADGHRDVLLAGLGSNLLLGDGTGRFTSFANRMQPFVFPLASADIDADGNLDLVGGGAASFGDLACFVYLGDGNGNFSQGISVAPPCTLHAFVDVTGDGKPDLVGSIGGNLAVIPAGQTNWFDTPIVQPEIPVKNLAVGDLDSDGDVDLVVLPPTVGSPARVLLNVFAPPTGSTAFGAGTPTCNGTIAMVATQPPVLGSQDFGIRCSNAPPDALGLMLMGPRYTAGWDPLGLDLTLHLLLAYPIGQIHSDAGGAARFSLPIPAHPWLSGLSVHLQSIWMGDPGLGNTCSRAQFELASSRGLTLRLRR